MATATVQHEGKFDDLVIGAGMAGLTVASVLASEGRRVAVLEAHDVPGGCAQTFSLGPRRFCAQVHYIFGCGEGEPVFELLKRLGLHETVTFNRLDPEGYDHVVVGGDRYRIPNGLDAWRDRLLRHFPGDAAAIRAYFDRVSALGAELDRLPSTIAWRDQLTSPLHYPSLLRHRSWTLQRLFDDVRMPQRLQAILAGQCGDYLLPPDQVSLLLHVSLIRAYDRGAYYPRGHFFGFIEAIAKSIDGKPGCRVFHGADVTRILVEHGEVAGVRTSDGRTFTARRYVSNVDPRATADLVGREHLPAAWLRTLAYEYSAGSVALYMTVKGMDLRDFGFGAHNTWSYPHDDLRAIYRAQHVDHDFTQPWLFIGTPTLHTDVGGLCPPGEQTLQVITGASYARFKLLREQDRPAYNREKKALRDHLVATLEERFVPGLSKHVAVRALGTPATHERFCRAPQGNAYGAALTPAHVSATGRIPHGTPLENLWLANATAGWPGIGGTVRAGLDLCAQLRRSAS